MKLIFGYCSNIELRRRNVCTNISFLALVRNCEILWNKRGIIDCMEADFESVYEGYRIIARNCEVAVLNYMLRRRRRRVRNHWPFVALQPTRNDYIFLAALLACRPTYFALERTLHFNKPLYRHCSGCFSTFLAIDPRMIDLASIDFVY